MLLNRNKSANPNQALVPKSVAGGNPSGLGSVEGKNRSVFTRPRMISKETPLTVGGIMKRTRVKVRKEKKERFGLVTPSLFNRRTSEGPKSGQGSGKRGARVTMERQRNFGKKFRSIMKGKIQRKG